MRLVSGRTSVTCPGVTPGCRVFGNRRWPCAPLTGGTRFVTVNQSFTKTFGRNCKICKLLSLQRIDFSVLLAVLVGRVRERVSIAKVGNAARKVRWSEQAFALVAILSLKLRT
jgi:hypothetical protein